MRAAGALILLTILGLAADEAGAQAPLRLACGGPIAQAASAASLASAFGAGNVRKADIDVAEGATEPGTVLFPDDPRRRLEILWHDAEKERRPSLIRVGEGSDWRIATPTGDVRMGLPLAEVEKLNGKPFTLNGFEWDYGGYATDWKGGTLGRLPGGCIMGLRFATDPQADEKAMLKVAGDVEFSSSAAVMRAVRPSVTQMTISWAE